MNANQKKYLIGVSVVMIIMLLFPTFVAHNSANGITFNAGNNFIFKPPFEACVVNLGLLLAQWLIVGTVGIIGWYILKSNK
jgi:hypothetical protein